MASKSAALLALDHAMMASSSSSSSNHDKIVTSDCSPPLVLLEKIHDGQITIITINRPEVRNAVDRPTAQALADAFRAFDSDPQSRVAILCGSGTTFCSGADLKAVSEGKDKMNRVEFEGDGPMGPSRMILSKPCIAAISGYAVAGGLELSLFCDLRVAEEDAIMGVFCRRFGVPLIDGGTVRLPHLIGLSRALDLILTGRPVTAQEALQIGLVHRVVPKGDARYAAIELARQLCAFPQQAMRGDRLSAYESIYNANSFEEAMRNELRHGIKALEQKETAEGATRFAVKREGRHGSFFNKTTQSKL